MDMFCFYVGPSFGALFSPPTNPLQEEYVGMDEVALQAVRRPIRDCWFWGFEATGFVDETYLGK